MEVVEEDMVEEPCAFFIVGVIEIIINNVYYDGIITIFIDFNLFLIKDN